MKSNELWPSVSKAYGPMGAALVVFIGILAILIVPRLSEARATAERSLREQLIGTWEFTATSGQRQDGTKFDLFGPNPNGVIIFQSDGHFALINTKPGRPKYAAGNRMKATDEEYKTTVQGSIAYFGTYTVDDSNSAFTFHIVGSTFPNYEGTNQKRPFTIIGDELRSINPAPTVGGPSLQLVLRRAK